MSSPAYVAFVGSRHWAHGLTPVAPVVAAVLAAGHHIRVGCCVGADVAVISSALQVSVGRSRLAILCAFGPGGVGAGPWSAVAPVAHTAALGVPITWWAGGGPSVSLPARLANRTRALLCGGACRGVVVFLQGAPGPHCGSWSAARFAATRGLPVVVVAPWATLANPLPPLLSSGGAFSPCFPALGSPAFVWASAQQPLVGLQPSALPFLV